MSKNKPIRMGVIQITRIGDVLQTYQAAKQLKRERPEVELTLIARKKFAKGLGFLLDEVFTNIVYVDVKDFIPSKTSGLDQARQRVGSFLEEIDNIKLDALINLSFSKSSSYLASLIQSKHKMGLRQTKNNQLEIRDQWSQYVYSTVMNSTLNPFNLVDIFKNILGAKTFTPEYKEKPRGDKIVLHPFASIKKKRWGANKWVDLLYKLAKENPDQEFFIVGSPEEQKESEALMESGALEEFRSRIHNLTGTTSIQETYLLLEEAKVLVCHDSMVAHLGAIAQIPTVALSLGPVRPLETNPYHHNTLNIVPKRKCFPCKVEEKCELLPCHKDISHQLTSQIVSAILNEETIDGDFFKRNVSPFYLQNVSVLAPRFTPMGMDLVDISESGANAEEVFKTFYKIMWSFYFKELELNYPLPQISKESLATLVDYTRGCDYIFELYSFGMRFSKEIFQEAQKENPKMDKIKENIGKLSEIDDLCAVTKQTYPLLTPIVDFFFVNKANAQGTNIIEITQSNLLSFHEGQNLIKIIYDLIQNVTGPFLERERNKSVKDKEV
ncbi:MAG: glycosyltransferase family 9 protein [Bacteriovoracaceae bacterium]